MGFRRNRGKSAVREEPHEGAFYNSLGAGVVLGGGGGLLDTTTIKRYYTVVLKTLGIQ